VFSLRPVCLRDKNGIEKLLRSDDVFLHLYGIGDLDDYFWLNATYYTLPGKGSRPIILLYDGLTVPCLLGLTGKSIQLMQELIRSMIPLLPKKFYAHLNEGLSALFRNNFQVQSHGVHFKMGLMDYSKLEEIDTAEVVRLTEKDLPELEKLYCISYPEHWFEPHMLQVGQYFGVCRNKNLVSVAGIHIHSERYKLAALGNIATHPDYRGQGLAKASCARLCQELIKTVDHIGLNVKADDESAISCYQKLGFESVHRYEECMLES
jgi:ribosomal protein S18 acetylase RimI-like enzyme